MNRSIEEDEEEQKMGDEGSYRDVERGLADRVKELAALDAIAASVSRSLELDEVLNDALDKVLEVLEFESGAIYLRDLQTGELQMARHRGLSEAFRRVVARGIISARAAQSGNPIIIDDLPKEPDAPKEVVEEGYRSVASIPLLSKGQVQGVLTTASRSLRRFHQQDVHLLLSIGNQIGIAIENAGLFQTERRRAEQFRVISEVGHGMTSILEIDQLLAQIVRLIHEAFGYYLVQISLIEGDEMVFNTAVGPPFDDPQFQPPPIKVGGKGITAWVAATGEPLLVPDVNQEPRYLLPPGWDEIQSELAVPLKTKSGVIGVLDVESDQLNAFDESDLVVLQSLAHQAAIAIENARLFDAEQRRAEQFRVISEVGRRMISILEIDQLLAQIVRLIHEAFGYYHVGIGLIEGDEVAYKVGAGLLWDDREVEFQPARLKVGQEGMTGWVAGTGEPLLAPDVSQEPRYVTMAGSKTRSELTVPIMVKRQVIGVLDVQSDRLNAFDQSDLTVLQSLAHQAGVAIENARLYERLQEANRKFEQELALAGQIQFSFLPDDLPDIPGWQLAAILEPARETAGDFYDFIPLPDGRLGIVVADVADKGAGAALYMALSWTLFRTFAREYPAQPELVLSAANRRIMTDTHTSMFVTVFYGILDPATGMLTYCNAGHNPPYLLSAQKGDVVQALRRTGMALGVVEDALWKQGVVQLATGDVLVVYTDGVTEAQNAQEAFFGEERLLEIAQANRGRSAQDMQDALIAGVHEFVGDASQFDDTTLMVVIRGWAEEQPALRVGILGRDPALD